MNIDEEYGLIYDMLFLFVRLIKEKSELFLFWIFAQLIHFYN